MRPLPVVFHLVPTSTNHMPHQTTCTTTCHTTCHTTRSAVPEQSIHTLSEHRAMYNTITASDRAGKNKMVVGRANHYCYIMREQQRRERGELVVQRKNTLSKEEWVGSEFRWVGSENGWSQS